MANFLNALPDSLKPYHQTVLSLIKNKESKVKFWNGYRFIPGFEPETAKYAKEHHEPKENEILIVSCPKTGTTWTSSIVRQLLYGDDEKLDLITRDLDGAMTYLELADCEKYNILHNMPIPRTYYGTHLPPELVNLEKYKSKNMKFIFTIRNPKDRLVSQFHFLQHFPWYPGTIQGDPKDWDAFFEREKEGKAPICMKTGEGYMEYILSWLPHIKGNDNAMILVYEEMIKDPQKEVRKLSDFLGLKKSDKEIKEVCEKTSFASAIKSDKTGMIHVMLRKGEIGDWKNYFTSEQSAFIDAEVEKKLEGTGIKFIYE